MTRNALRLVVAALVLHLLLIQPNHPDAATWGALALFPLELPVILLGLAAVPPGRWANALRVVLVAVLSLIAVLKAADYAMYSALSRGFNPVSDLVLIEAGMRLVLGAIGPVQTLAAAAAALLAFCAVALAVWWSTGVWTRLRVSAPAAVGLATVAVFSAGVAAAEVGHAMGRWSLPVSPPGAAFTARVGMERIGMVRSTLADLRAFTAAASNDPLAGRPGLLRAIDRDVLVVFVESYGRTSLDTPLYAGTHRATLAEADARLGALGLSRRSGLLRAPTRGGQSWLSHATFANGLWVDNQTSYRAVLASSRMTLFHAAAQAGFRTAAVMPQITMAWPEASVMGFETVLGASDLGYAGLPFNWVTMPDQFTFTALDRLLRDDPDDRPLFVQIALGSSHAPWVPVPEIVPWDQVGDGTIFDAMAQAGDPPDVVWRDRDRVRDQYRQAIDYALRVIFDYAALHAADPPLIFVVGDHQAARFVALDERPDVPVHVIGPASLVSATADWGWNEGLLPDDAAVAMQMDRMRDLILQSYAAEAAQGGDS